MFRKCHVPTVVVLAVALLAVGGAHAQSTTGRIIGTVIDQGGEGLPGASVTISSDALIGGPRTAIADDDGNFQFISLHPGKYTVKIHLSGFVSQERQEVKVSLGGAAALNIIMPQGRFESEIEVVAQTPVIDPTQVNTEQVFDLSYMQQAAIGSDNRNYLYIVGQAPGVTGRNNPNVLGSTPSENAYFIDGVDTTEPLTGTWGTLYNYDAIAEIEIQTSGFEAEYGRSTGGLVNVLTKSGGNQFSGTLDIRYRGDSFQESGEYYDASGLESSFQDIAATLGGPIVRDKLWFFAAYELVNSKRTPSGSPTTRDFDGENYNLKLTWQMAPSWRLMGRASGDPAEIANHNPSQFTAPEATSRQKQGADVYALELNAVLSDSLMWNTVAGAYRSTTERLPMSGDLRTPSHFNSGTFMTTENFPNQQYSERNRTDLATDLTWFVGDLAGSHEFKVGVQYSKTEFPGVSCLTGTEGGACSPGSVGYSYDDFGITDEFGNLLFTLPSGMTEKVTAGEQNYNGQLGTAYLQDSWRVLPNLTLKVGLRYDQVSYDNNTDSKIADMSKVQPRLGVAWDITNDAKNVVRANWGRFMDPSTLSLPFVLREGNEPTYSWLSCSTWGTPLLGIPDPTQCEFFTGIIGFPYRSDDPDGMDPFGWFQFPGTVSGIGQTLVQPDLRATYADTLSLSYEREVGQRASVELTIVDKKTRDLFEDTCAGNYPVPTEGADCSEYLLGNLPDLARDYQAFIVRYETRSFSWLTLLASYTYSKSEGNLEWNQGESEDFDLYPWHFDNRYGYLRDHRAHRFKLNGFIYIKGDWTIAFDGSWSSAFTWEPQALPFVDIVDPTFWYGFYYTEPRGSREAFNAYNLDLQLSKGFTIGNRVRLVAIGSVYNTFNTENGITVCNAVSGCGAYETGEATAWNLPRSYELGFRVEF
jgi:hypothetical protein